MNKNRPETGGGKLTQYFSLHLITDRKTVKGDLVPAVKAALKGGVDWLQLREKSRPALELYEIAQAVIPYARSAGVGVLINDRVDVALVTEADGVHLARKSLPPEAVKPLLGTGLTGASVHSLNAAREAVARGADYVTFGHIYPTASKAGLPPRGVLQLSEIVESVDVPVLAIGGIDVEKVHEVLSTGCAGIAVISSILASPDPRQAALRLRDAMDASPARPRYPFPNPTIKERYEDNLKP